VVPMEYVGREYSELVEALLQVDIVTLGLYRPRGTANAPLPYAVINPSKETALAAEDMVYVLRPPVRSS
jgi:hypothetical protein